MQEGTLPRGSPLKDFIPEADITLRRLGEAPLSDGGKIELIIGSLWRRLCAKKCRIK